MLTHVWPISNGVVTIVVLEKINSNKIVSHGVVTIVDARENQL